MTESITNSKNGSDPKDATILPLAFKIYDLLQEKKARDIQLMDLRQANPYFCYFLIATANSTMQLKSLLRDISKEFGSELPQKYSLRPGDVDSGWVVLDFIDLVVHLFLGEQRSFYNLERLWGDAPRIEFPNAPESTPDENT